MGRAGLKTNLIRRRTRMNESESAMATHGRMTDHRSCTAKEEMKGGLGGVRRLTKGWGRVRSSRSEPKRRTDLHPVRLRTAGTCQRGIWHQFQPVFSRQLKGRVRTDSHRRESLGCWSEGAPSSPTSLRPFPPHLVQNSSRTSAPTSLTRMDSCILPRDVLLIIRDLIPPGASNLATHVNLAAASPLLADQVRPSDP